MHLSMILSLLASMAMQTHADTWVADNGNGTYTNPIFHDEFSDPDVIRVGNAYYMTGTTMHTMPGLPVLRSYDLVNWELLTYAEDRLDLGPEYRLQDGQGAYGAGFWAPSIRHHDGVYYIFSNVNRHGLQIYSATDPAGPWRAIPFDGDIHDVSVLFDDDGRIYGVYNYGEVRMVEFKPDLSGIVEGSERVVIPPDKAMGEGHHFYKINGQYYIISANYSPVGWMQAARADRPEGPYETVAISARESLGRSTSAWVNGDIRTPEIDTGADIEITPPGDTAFGAVPLHQGGVVSTPEGAWWGFSMMDYGVAGRMTVLSPVTWKDGWPYFGLEGNLGRTPRTWVKPDSTSETSPTATWPRDDDFDGGALNPTWQWNHAPWEDGWSLTSTGALRLETLPAAGFLAARNTLTQRVVGPVSSATVKLDGRGLEVGDVAGLALLGYPYYWIGLVREEDGFTIRVRNRLTQTSTERPVDGARVVLKADGDYDAETARFSYSTDGQSFTRIGGALPLAYQLKTFQGYRYALFAYSTSGEPGGHALFDDFDMTEPLADRSGNIPLGKIVRIENLADGHFLTTTGRGFVHKAAPGSEAADGEASLFRVHDRGRGRVALEAVNGEGFLTVAGLGLAADARLTAEEDPRSLFQWQDMLRREFMLMSLHNHRHLGVDVSTGEPYSVTAPGAAPDRRGGAVLRWTEFQPSAD